MYIMNRRNLLFPLLLIFITIGGLFAQQDAQYTQYMFNTMRTVIDEKINNIWFQEAFLHSDELRTAGQVDCIAEYEGELSVSDFKTLRRLKKEENITISSIL